MIVQKINALNDRSVDGKDDSLIETVEVAETLTVILPGLIVFVQQKILLIVDLHECSELIQLRFDVIFQEHLCLLVELVGQWLGIGDAYRIDDTEKSYFTTLFSLSYVNELG